MYIFTLYLQEYARRLVKKPYVREGMELVEQPSDHEAACDCHRLKQVRHKTHFILISRSDKSILRE